MVINGEIKGSDNLKAEIADIANEVGAENFAVPVQKTLQQPGNQKKGEALLKLVATDKKVFSPMRQQLRAFLADILESRSREVANKDQNLAQHLFDLSRKMFGYQKK